MSDNQYVTAVFWMLGAMFSLFVTSVVGRELSEWYSTYEIMGVRSVIGFFGLIIAISAFSSWKQVNIRRIPLHITRNLFHFTAQNLWLFALAGLPLATVIAFEFTTPIWVILLAALFLDEGFNRKKLLVILFGLAGVIIITGFQKLQMSPALLAAFSCAIGFALTTIFTKKLVKTQTVTEILLMMLFCQGVFSAIILIFIGNPITLAPESYVLLLLISICGLSSHWCLTEALHRAPASLVAPIDLLRLPLSAGYGVFVYHESLGFGLILGSLLLICANLINILKK